VSTTGKAIANAFGAAAEAEATSLSTLIAGPDPEQEFATLVERLIVHQGRQHGFKVEIVAHEDSRDCRLPDGGLLGLKRATYVEPLWVDSAGPLNQQQCLDAFVQSSSPGFFFRIGRDHYLPVFPKDITEPGDWDWQAFGNTPHQLPVRPAGAAQVLQWLRDCPPLLARYLPQQAKRHPDSNGFSGLAWTTIRDDFLRLSLPARSDLGVERMSAKHTEDEGRPVTVQLPDVFVAQQFVPQGQPLSAALPLAALLSRPGPVVLLGDPGSGKSTVLSALALAAAGRHAIEDTQVPPAVPLFLPLRRYSREQTSHPRLLDALVAQARRKLKMAVGDAHPWFFQGLLEMGQALVLFDGLDEAGDQRTRAGVVQQIEEFHRNYPLCGLWVTSRKVGYDGAPLDADKFETFTVAPFDRPRRERFIRRWYTDQYRDEPAVGEQFSVSLCQAMQRARPDVQRMAGNPLLLTLMALIHRSKRGFLPHNRGELYEECVELLLGRWEKAKRDPDEPDDPAGDLAQLNPRLERTELRRYLTTIAFEIQEQNEQRSPEEWGNIPCQFLRKRLTELRQATRREADSENAAADVRVLLRYIQDRAGLLVWNGEDAYAFSHLSFQEYLAACKRQGGDFRFDDHIHFFAQKAAEPKWRETLVLLLHRIQAHSTAEEPFTDRLMEFLVGHALARQPAQAIAVWRTLGMALRDQIPFAPAHQREILLHLFDDWLLARLFEGETNDVLTDLALFSPGLRELLTGLLVQLWRDAANPARALATLHLRVRLLGWPHRDAAESAGTATELLARLPDPAPPARARPLLERAGLLLAEARPAQFVTDSPGHICVRTVRDRLAILMFDPRLPIVERDSSAQALGRLGDSRQGVGMHPDGPWKDLPEFEWLSLPAGKFTLGETGKAVAVHAFQLSRYPVTVAQFEAFRKAEDGYHNEQCWQRQDVPGMLEWWRKNHEQGPEDYDPVFQTPNHPRVGVCWYEAVAFCRWLSRRRGFDPDGPEAIRLPHENEWEWAARWDGQQADDRYFPWENSKKDDPDLAQRCNCAQTGLGHTSAVGLFPKGAAGCGASDMTGNVWEWCDNWYDEKSRQSRVLRGGSWALGLPERLSCSYRIYVHPSGRSRIYGFRCVVVGSSVRECGS
jgi:formylglycine-generating enzyme required for sulfatase activity